MSENLPTRRRILLFAGAAICTGLLRGLAEPLPLGLDRDGHAVASLTNADTRVIVLLFVASDCPISNRYLPQILRLAEQFHSRGARFWLVYPNPADDLDRVRAHQVEFADAAGLDALILPHPRLIRQAGVHVTPEAALFRTPFSLEQPALWHGPIDNRYLSIGSQRSAPTQHDLAVALDTALGGGIPAPPTSHAVGCAIIRAVGTAEPGAEHSVRRAISPQ